MERDLYIVLFTKSQLDFIKHVVNEKAINDLEDECVDVLSTIGFSLEQAEKIEKTTITYRKEYR